MLERNQVIQTIQAHKAELEGLGVKSIYLFGSVARNEATETSDVDVLVELSREMGWEFFEIQFALERWLQRPVDLGTFDSLHPRIRAQVQSEIFHA
jgi:uncharacterized protein